MKEIMKEKGESGFNALYPDNAKYDIKYNPKDRDGYIVKKCPLDGTTDFAVTTEQFNGTICHCEYPNPECPHIVDGFCDIAEAFIGEGRNGKSRFDR